MRSAPEAMASGRPQSSLHQRGTLPEGKKDAPIFVVGSARSGTTLLQRMLRSHPNISSPTGESHFIIPLYRKQETFGDLSQIENVRLVLQEMYRISPRFLDTDFHGMNFDIDVLSQEIHDEGRDTLAGIISAVFEKNAYGEGKRRWLDKTPYYVLYLDMIKELYPDARIIHIIRDGRDCALSMFTRKYDLDVFNSYRAAKLWKLYVDAGQEAGERLGPESYFELKYEDLLSDPVATMQALCSFIEEEYCSSLIDFEKSRDKKSKTPLLSRPLQRGNLEKWRTGLTARQIRVFESVAGDTLVRNGYDLVTHARRLPLPVRAAYEIHNRVLKGFNRKFLKPRR